VSKREPGSWDAGVREALGAAYRQHYLPLLRLGVALSRSRDAAEDLTQDAFVRAAPRLVGLSETEVMPYLRQALVNLWKNRLRRLALETRHRTSFVEQRDEQNPEERHVMLAMLRRLPSRQRACVVLRYYEDLPERTVAQLLGCSVGAVKSNTSRGLRRLRREIADGD
jgi:RNA polymerase sigma-70 factor (sigma-E family)